MQKIFGHPGSDSAIAAVLERAHQSGSDIENRRYEQSQKDRQLLLDRGTAAVEELTTSGAPDEKLELARSSLERQLAAQDEAVAKFAPPDAAEMAALRGKHLSLQAAAGSAPPAETSPCLVVGRQADNGSGEISYSGLRIEVDQARQLSDREEIIEYLRQHGDDREMVVRLPAQGEGQDRAHLVETDHLLTEFLVPTEGETPDTIKTAITFMPCRPVIIDAAGILNMRDIWDQVIKNGEPEHIERCPDIYAPRPDMFHRSVRHLLDARISETERGTVAGRFTAEYPDLEALIGVRVDAVLNAAGPEAQKTGSGPVDLANVVVTSPFGSPQPRDDHSPTL